MISVIIPTYNGAHKIETVLSALTQQTVLPFEIIVVVDGSTDNTIEVVKSFEQIFSRLRIIQQANSGRAAVRNRGASEASGDILIFYDDDMKPHPDSVAQHASFHGKQNGILSGNQVEHERPDKTEIQNYKAHLTWMWTSKYSDGLNKLNPSNLFFTAANCSIKKSIFIALGGFDNTLTDAEDHDFAARALENGIDVFFDKENIALHNDPITCHSYINRLRAYAEAHQKLKQLHPGRYKTAEKKSFVVLKRIAYYILSFRIWSNLVDKQFFRFLPRRYRYKLYDGIIQASAIEFSHPI
jgi:glycosyltransferase involved in cell wall biosynthesis